MPDEAGRFQTKGLSWAERAKLGGLRAVISPTASARSNAFLAGVHEYAASRFLRELRAPSSIVDFGCGNGRFARLFAANGHRVLGTEITKEMIDGVPSDEHCTYALTDGVHIPAPDASVDAIWCCGVLRFSLFVDEPKHHEIAAEMFRVLRPGGFVLNVEVFVDQPADVFASDFTRAGFTAETPRVVHRYGGGFEHHLKHPRLSSQWMPWLGARLAQMRFYLDSVRRQPEGLRDYLFHYTKPR